GAAVGTSISELLVAGALIALAGELHGRLDFRRMLTGPVLASAGAGALMFLLHDKALVAAALAIVAYFALLLGYERIAFPEDFSVLHVLVTQLRARIARPAASGRLT
ncbi:MAG: hypothetical protein ACHP93_03260, partial [Solirubrobacterales bacterium]